MTDLPADRRAPTHPEHTAGPTGSAEAALDRIWRRIRRPVEPMGAVQALVGIPRRTARQVVGAATAGSDEATALLAAMPQLVRNLSISTVAAPQRCVGEVRGPVLWSETLSARAATAGDTGVFVCQTVSRAYDTHENRLLVAALGAIVAGGRDVERFHGHDAEDDGEPDLLATARHHADLAERFLDHRTLIAVRREPDRRRALSRMRNGRKRREYAPVLAMLERAAEPLDVETIRLFCNEVSTARHDLLVAVVDHLEARGVRVPDFLVVDQTLVAGPVRFHHPALVRRSGSGRTGLFVGSTRLDVPAGLPADQVDAVISNRGDLVRAVDAAIIADDL